MSTSTAGPLSGPALPAAAPAGASSPGDVSPGASLTSPLLQLPGAVAAEGVDAGTAWHYGDPTREQRLLEAGEAVVDLSHRGVVTVTGPDRLTWLDTLSTQWLRDLSPGTPAEALILSPHGHIENALHVVDDGAATWLTVEPGAATTLVAHLERMRFLLRVEVRDVTDRWAVLAETSPTPSAAAATGVSWLDPWPATAADGVRYAPVDDSAHPAAGRTWREVLVPRADLPSAVAGRPLAGTWAAEALRVVAWRPRFGVETDHRSLPHELDWLRTAVHLRKGCYRGQETVARVHNLGRPPRRLAMLHLDGSGHVLPAAGDPVLGAERPVGVLTTVARHHELGPVALAVLKRTTPVDAALRVGSVAAAQEVVVAP